VWVSFVLSAPSCKKPLNQFSRKRLITPPAGNYEIDFDIQGAGEVVELANSIRKLDRARPAKSNKSKGESPYLRRMCLSRPAHLNHQVHHNGDVRE